MVLTIEQAKRLILKQIRPSVTLDLPLLAAADNYLAADVRAPLPIPLFNNSAMDGFAVRTADIKRVPATLKVVEEIPAGCWPRRKLGPGEAALIMTGAVVPPGADSVVMVENTDMFNNQSSKYKAKEVVIYKKIKKRENIRWRGEVLKPGEVLLKRGQWLRPPEIALLATVNVDKVKVFQRPKVAILSTGSEVVPLGRPLRPGQIVDSNRCGLTVQLKQWGAEVIDLGIADDSRMALTRKIKLGLKRADVLVTIGGVSVGKWDFVKEVVEKLGRIIFWKVKMKPGGPMTFGQIGQKLFFGLPGNPVSTLIAAEFFVKPALEKLRGRRGFDSAEFYAILTGDYQSRPGKVRLERVQLTIRQGLFYARPTRSLGSGDMRSLTEANGIMIVPEKVSHLRRGQRVLVWFI